MTILSTEECVEHLKYNATQTYKGSSAVRGKIEKGLPLGLTGHGLFCTEGKGEVLNGKRVYKSSCKGDSGGPLKTLDPNNEDRDTLIGVVSGGVTCGTLLIPTWQTRVSYHTKWINCIIDKTTYYLNVGTFNQTKVMEDCKDVRIAKPAPTEPNNDTLLGGGCKDGDDEKDDLTIIGDDELTNDNDDLFDNVEPTNDDDDLFGDDELTNDDDGLFDDL